MVAAPSASQQARMFTSSTFSVNTLQLPSLFRTPSHPLLSTLIYVTDSLRVVRLTLGSEFTTLILARSEKFTRVIMDPCYVQATVLMVRFTRVVVRMALLGFGRRTLEKLMGCGKLQTKVLLIVT